MESEYFELSMRDLRKLLPCATDENLADDLLISDVRMNDELNAFIHPCRFDGFLAFFCYEGEFALEINLTRVNIHSGTLVIYTPGNIVRAVDTKDLKDLHIVVVAVSRALMTGTRFDFDKLYDESLRILENPCVELNEKEQTILHKYLDLAVELSSMGLKYAKDSIMTLFSSTFYLMGAMWTDRLSEARAQAAVGTGGRTGHSKVVFKDFLDLVKTYHNKERNLDFYANKLYLTPKYLSKLVKGVSGRTASEWIDSFVILEAKNMLKCSDLSIKDVVYSLNFASQTTFYRFFKAQTGMTPTEFRES